MISSRQAWAEHVRQSALEGRIKMGTTAHHLLGDISRDKPDYFYTEEERDDVYVGQWLTGFGFVQVEFPKDTVRDMTEEEVEWLAERPVVIG